MTEPARHISSLRIGSVARIVLRLCALAVAVYAVHFFIQWANAQAQMGRDGLGYGVLAALIAIYIVLMALPFVPGAELSMSLLVIEGSRIAPVIYLSTVVALCLAFAAGAWLPTSALLSLFEDLGLQKAKSLFEKFQELDRSERLGIMGKHVPGWLRPFVTRYRFLMLAVLINTPGNSIIGGGGGIMFAAGLSRMFHPLATVLTIAIAVIPVPLAFWLYGVDLLGR